MCLKPSFIWVQRGPKWVQQLKPCGDCWRCKRNWINDYIGRCLAEASTSEVACTVSMTYAPRDDLADKILTPHHFQLFMKLLRNAGHKVRYLVAGEYGDLKGRAHFHVILFFKRLRPLVDPKSGKARGVLPRYKDDYPEGTKPEDWGRFCREIPQKAMVHIAEWPHGHIIVDWSMTHKSVRYCCAYARSADKNNSWWSLSKKPPLGAEFFAQKAAKARELGVIPSTFEYFPPGGDRRHPYLMTGATRRDFLAALQINPARRKNMSEWVQRSFDKYERVALLKSLDAEQRQLVLDHWLPDAQDGQDWKNPHDAHYVSWWLGQKRLGIDQPFDWRYPFCDWRPNHGKASFFQDQGIFNPKRRPPERAVAGYSDGVPRPPSSEHGASGRGVGKAARSEDVESGPFVITRPVACGSEVFDPETGEVLGYFDRQA